MEEVFPSSMPEHPLLLSKGNVVGREGPWVIVFHLHCLKEACLSVTCEGRETTIDRCY